MQFSPASEREAAEMETLYAYLAGAIDIDGRIIIERVHGFRRRSDGRQVSYYKASIKLSDSSPILPDLLQATFPARRLQYKAKNRKQAEWHMWEAVNHSAHEPMARLMPYLRLKHRQAEIALTLITLVKHDRAGSGSPLTDEQEQARRLLFEEAQRLNESRPRRMYR